MSLEQAITTLTAAVEALTAKVNGATVGTSSKAAEKPAAAEKEETSKPAAKTAKTTKTAKAASVNTREAMQALLSRVKEEKGTDEARAIIKEHAGVGKMADIPEDKIDAVFDAATTLLDGDDEGDDEGEGGI